MACVFLVKVHRKMLMKERFLVLIGGVLLVAVMLFIIANQLSKIVNQLVELGESLKSVNVHTSAKEFEVKIADLDLLQVRLKNNFQFPVEVKLSEDRILHVKLDGAKDS